MGGDAYVYGFDGGDGFIGVHLSPNSLSYIHDISTTFTCQSCSIKWLLKSKYQKMWILYLLWNQVHIISF